MKYRMSLLLAIAVFSLSRTTLAADAQKPQASPTPGADAQGAEQVNVENIKEKYWARGEESELGVVQNRTYSKAGKFEFGLFVGNISSDPFVSTESFGAHVGYYFSEYFGLQFIGWKSWATLNSSTTALESQIQSIAGVPFVPSTDFANGFYGTEANWSLLYGKLSLLGKSILYFDLRLIGGLGITTAQAANYITPYAGIGESIYVSKVASIRFDYRLMFYQDQLIQTSQPNAPGYGIPYGPYRNNWTNSITLGVDFLIGGSRP